MIVQSPAARVKPATGLFCSNLHTDLSPWLYQSIVAYVDDVLVAHPAGQLREHLQVVVDAFSKLARKGWSVKPSKFKLLPETFVYLGHLSTRTGNPAHTRRHPSHLGNAGARHDPRTWQYQTCHPVVPRARVLQPALHQGFRQDHCPAQGTDGGEDALRMDAGMPESLGRGDRGNRDVQGPQAPEV